MATARSGKNDVVTPLSGLPLMPLTPSGLPRLDTSDAEVELLTRPHVELRSVQDSSAMAMATTTTHVRNHHNSVDRSDKMTLLVTTHRLVFLPGAHFLHLSSIRSCTIAGKHKIMGLLTGSSFKIGLATTSYGELQLCLDVANDRDAVLEVLQKALHRQAWLLQSKLEEKKQQQQHTYKTRKVGVDAVLAKNKQRHREAAKLADSAFATDVDTLLSEASELVAIIHRYTAALNQQQSHHSSTESDDSNSNNDAVELSNMLEDMGMASALSRDQFGKGSRRKKSSNNDYYDQTIARQLSDFLRYKNRLTDAGGLMTLTDVYCLFNRARGTNMISPNDLLRAVAWMDQPEFAHLRMHQRTFPSGVVVLQDADFDEEGTSQKLQELATSAHPESGGDGGVTALHVSKALKISAMLANEQLLSAERLGYLCRDVTLEGIRFFPNRFNTYIT